MAPSDICDYVQEFYPPKKIEPLPESGSVTHVVDDDFVFPVRSREIEEANEQDVEDLDIEKVLEKVFAENDRSKLEKKMNGLYLTDLENPEAQNVDRQMFSYSLMSMDRRVQIPQMPMSLRQTRIDGNEIDVTNIEEPNPLVQSINSPSNVEEAEFGFDRPNDFKNSSPQSINNLISQAEKFNESDNKLLSINEENSKAQKYVELEKKKWANRQQSFEQDRRNQDREEEDDDEVFHGETVPFRPPSQVISDFSDSGHDELIFSNPDTPSDYPVPSRPQTLLLTSSLSNSEALYNYKQNTQPMDDQVSQENICYNPSEELEDLIGTFADANPQSRSDNQSNSRSNQINFEGLTRAKVITTNKKCLTTESALTVCQTATTTSVASNGHKTTTTAIANCSTMGNSSAVMANCSTTMGQCSATSQSSGFVSWGSGAAENLLVNKTGGLMLWKKVQNVVVVCGEMVNSNTAMNPESNPTPDSRRTDFRGIRRHQQQSLD